MSDCGSGPLRVACVGLGWVTTNRHIPWLRRNPRVRLVGVIDRRPDRIEAAGRRHGVARTAIASTPGDVPWLDEVDAVTIGTPPLTHASLSRAFLEAGKHVLQEKPFAMSPEEAAGLETAAARAGRTLAVVHNFQFSRSVERLRRLVAAGSLGEVRSIWGVQLSNPARRLPAWYEELPLGLFTDESPHLLYLVRCLSPSDPVADHVRVVPGPAGRATPRQVDVALHADEVRIRVSLDFEAPVSEWHVAVLGSRRLAVADLFRDVLVVAGADGPHRARDILRTSWSALSGHLAGVVSSGARVATGRLSYGNDEVVRRFVDACLDGAPLDGIAPADGRWVTAAQAHVADAAPVSQSR